jgi:hypothetical protein
MIRVARFDPVKLALYGAAAAVMTVVSLWWMANADAMGGVRPSAVLGGLFAGAVAIVTGYRVWGWKHPAIGVVQGHVVAFGLKAPIPVHEIEDISESMGVDPTSWSGLVIYRKDAPLRRIHTWLIEGDRKVVCGDLREADGLPRDPPRR